MTTKMSSVFEYKPALYDDIKVELKRLENDMNICKSKYNSARNWLSNQSGMGVDELADRISTLSRRADEYHKNVTLIITTWVDIHNIITNTEERAFNIIRTDGKSLLEQIISAIWDGATATISWIVEWSDEVAEALSYLSEAVADIVIIAAVYTLATAAIAVCPVLAPLIFCAASFLIIDNAFKLAGDAVAIGYIAFGNKEAAREAAGFGLKDVFVAVGGGVGAIVYDICNIASKAILATAVTAVAPAIAAQYIGAKIMATGIKSIGHYLNPSLNDFEKIIKVLEDFPILDTMKKTKRIKDIYENAKNANEAYNLLTNS